MKKCTKCFLTKQLNQYTIQRPNHKFPYRYTFCDKCKVEVRKEYYYRKGKYTFKKFMKNKRNRMKIKIRKKLSNLKMYYGISKHDFYFLLKKQKHKCSICGYKQYPYDKKWPCVDHDHKTKRIRGLLCAMCNKGIGFFKDDITLLEKAIKYLKN